MSLSRKKLSAILAGAMFAFASISAFSIWGDVSAMANSNNDRKHRTSPINERFSSLREFLAWQNGMHRRMADFPWYEEVRPGAFRYHRSRGQAQDNHEYTKEELMHKLGFSS